MTTRWKYGEFSAPHTPSPLYGQIHPSGFFAIRFGVPNPIHIPSGRGMGWFPSIRTAKAFCNELAQLNVDWNNISDANVASTTVNGVPLLKLTASIRANLLPQ